MKSQFLKKYGLLVIMISVGLSFIINQVALRGATTGGSDISKGSTFRANLDSGGYYWSTYPYALIISLGLAAIIILIGSLLLRSNK